MITVPLKSLCQVKHGGTPSKANPNFWGGDIPWVSPKDMKASVLADASDRITCDAVAGSATSIVPPKSILVVVRSGILAHSLPVAQVARPVAFNQDIKALIPDENLIDPDYLYWVVRASEQNVLTRGVKKGATVHSVQSGFIENLSVPIPARAEQRRIVDLLSRADGIVRLRREAEKKATEVIPALFIDMFGDPARNPKGWPIVRLADVLAEPPTLGTMAKPSAAQGEWLDLRVANIQGGQLRLEDKKWLDLPTDQIDRFALRAGDVVLARAIGSLDHLGKAVVVYPDSNWTFDSHLMRVRVKPSLLLPEVFKAFLESAGGREEFLKHTRRSAVQFNVNGKELRDICMPLPPNGLQQEYLRQLKCTMLIQSRQAAATVKAEAVFNALLTQVFSPTSKGSFPTVTGNAEADAA